MTITKKNVNGKNLVTSCTIANCCLTVEVIEGETVKDDANLTLTNERHQELFCTASEFAEIAEHLYLTGVIKLDKIRGFLCNQTD
jgi:hypothetical protein